MGVISENSSIVGLSQGGVVDSIFTSRPVGRGSNLGLNLGLGEFFYDNLMPQCLKLIVGHAKADQCY